MNQLDKIIAYENGELDDEATVELFQDLVTSGLAWQLQGSYGRMAAHLIQNGLVTQPGRKEADRIDGYDRDDLGLSPDY